MSKRLLQVVGHTSNSFLLVARVMPDKACGQKKSTQLSDDIASAWAWWERVGQPKTWLAPMVVSGWHVRTSFVVHTALLFRNSRRGRAAVALAHADGGVRRNECDVVRVRGRIRARTERVRVPAVRRGVEEGRARERDVRGVRAGRVRGHAIGERSFAVTMCLGDGFQHTTEISIAASHV